MESQRGYNSIEDLSPEDKARLIEAASVNKATYDNVTTSEAMVTSIAAINNLKNICDELGVSYQDALDLVPNPEEVV